MVAETIGGIADTVVERVSDRTAPARVRTIDPELEPLALDIAVEVEVRDAGLDQRERPGLVHPQDPVHPFQIEHDAARQVRRRTAVAQILTGGNRIDGNAITVRGSHDLLDFLDAERRNGGRYRDLLGLAAERRIGILVHCDIVVARKDPLAADGVAELLEHGIPVGCRDSRWNGHNGAPVTEPWLTARSGCCASGTRQSRRARRR